MRWIGSMIWAFIASLTTNGLLAFLLGGLDRAWVIAVVTLFWLVLFLWACPRIYQTAGRPNPPA